MNNERGGILSNLILIPAGLALMVGFFLLGYYVGKYQGKDGKTGESLPPLPDVVSKNLPSLPKPEDFTFYKTLTEKGNVTVSIDLKPRAETDEKKTEKEHATAPSKESAPARRKPAEPKPEKKASPAKQAPVEKSRYTVQVSSHQEKEAAEQDVRRMKQHGFAAFIVSTNLPGKGTWYRVRVGSFTRKDSAEKLLAELRASTGGEPIMVVE